MDMIYVMMIEDVKVVCVNLRTIMRIRLYIH